MFWSFVANLMVAYDTFCPTVTALGSQSHPLPLESVSRQTLLFVPICFRILFQTQRRHGYVVNSYYPPSLCIHYNMLLFICQVSYVIKLHPHWCVMKHPKDQASTHLLADIHDNTQNLWC